MSQFICIDYFGLIDFGFGSFSFYCPNRFIRKCWFTQSTPIRFSLRAVNSVVCNYRWLQCEIDSQQVTNCFIHIDIASEELNDDVRYRLPNAVYLVSFFLHFTKNYVLCACDTQAIGKTGHFEREKWNKYKKIRAEKKMKKRTRMSCAKTEKSVVQWQRKVSTRRRNESGAGASQDERLYFCKSKQICIHLILTNTISRGKRAYCKAVKRFRCLHRTPTINGDKETNAAQRVNRATLFRYELNLSVERKKCIRVHTAQFPVWNIKKVLFFVNVGAIARYLCDCASIYLGNKSRLYLCVHALMASPLTKNLHNLHDGDETRG